MTNYNEIKLSPAEAFDLYNGEFPNTTVIEVELESKSGNFVYKVKGFDEEKEYKVYVNAITGKISEVNEKISKGMFTQIMRKHTDQIDELVSESLKDAGNNAKLCEWSLEVDEGILELTVEIDLENRESLKYKYNLISKDLIKKK